LGLSLFLSFLMPLPKSFFQQLFSRAWDALLYLTVLSVGLLYSEDLQTGYRTIETSLSLLALPLMFCRFDHFTKDQLQKVCYAFSAGVLVASVICLVNAIIGYSSSGDIEVFFSDRLTAIINSHPTYLAYFIIAVMTFGLYHLYFEEVKSPRLIAFSVFFCFVVLMLTGGVTAFISLLLIFSFFVLKYILEQKSRMQTLTVTMVVVLILCMFAFNTINIEEKNDYWERFVLWESALRATPNVIWGVGTGDYKNVLNEYYVSHNLQNFANSSLNSHNQFIEVLFSNGAVGVLALLFLLGRPLYASARNQNLLGTLTFFPFIIYGMTEVFLGRYQGVVFFALFHQAFLSHYQRYKPAFQLKEI